MQSEDNNLLGRTMSKNCGKCGGSLEAGIATAIGLVGGAVIDHREPRMLFVVPGSPTSLNPVKAFQQGLAQEPATRVYGISGFRCSLCGVLELYADGEPTA